MINDYDKRQLTLMLEKILLFRQKSLSLSSLINDLESLIDVLENVDSTWRNKCREYWWDLEEIYATALDRELSSLDTEDWQIITNALDEIETLIKNILPSDEN